jgi:hypothetical protein
LKPNGTCYPAFHELTLRKTVICAPISSFAAVLTMFSNPTLPYAWLYREKRRIEGVAEFKSIRPLPNANATTSLASAANAGSNFIFRMGIGV